MTALALVLIVAALLFLVFRALDLFTSREPKAWRCSYPGCNAPSVVVAVYRGKELDLCMDCYDTLAPRLIATVPR